MHVYHFILDHRTGGPHVYVAQVVAAGNVPATVILTGVRSHTPYLVNLRSTWAPLYVFEVVMNSVLLVIWALRTGIRRRGTVFHVHGASHIAPLLAARLLAIPVIWQIHDTTKSLRALAELGKWILRHHPRHRILAVARASIAAYELGAVEVLPAPIDTAFWNGLRHATSSHSRHIVTIGNLNPLKGTDVLLSALELLDLPWRLTIVGLRLDTHAGFAAVLDEKAKRIFEITGQEIRFAGWQARETVRTLLSSCDVFVLPSRSEACPIALLEAMAMECLCVASDVGDVAGLLPELATHFVVPADNPGRLASAILSILSLPEDAKAEYRMAVRQRVQTCHQPRQIAERLNYLYGSLTTAETNLS